jgi:hypothetical protein
MPIGLRGIESYHAFAPTGRVPRVQFRNGADTTARIVETLGETIELGRALAALAPERQPLSKARAVTDRSA